MRAERLSADDKLISSERELQGRKHLDAELFAGLRLKKGIGKERALRKRVLASIPHWPHWPRSLRETYVKLPTHGYTDDGLRDIARSMHIEYEELAGMIERCPTFKKALEDYRREHAYPHTYHVRRDGSLGVVSTRQRVRHDELMWLLAAEAAVLAPVELARKMNASQALRLMEATGLLSRLPETIEGEGESGVDVYAPSGLTTFAPEVNGTDGE